MALDLGTVLLGTLEWLDRMLDHGFAILLMSLVVCLSALAWRFVDHGTLWWVVKVLVALWIVLLMAFFGGFLVWLVGRRWAGR